MVLSYLGDNKFFEGIFDMKNKLIVSDLDGTLLNSEKIVSEKSIQVLKKCHEKGFELMVATARPPRYVYDSLPNFLQEEFVICYNGALVLKNREPVYRKGISKASALDVLQEAQDLGFDKLALEMDDKLYTNFDADVDYGWKPFELVDFQTLAFDEALKIMICSDQPMSDEILTKLPQSCAGVITDNGTLCQIMHADVSKWNAIKHVVDLLALREFEVIAFGDDHNDSEMIKNSHVGVAMNNAVSELKESADHVTLTNDEDGVAVFLEENYVI